MDFKNIQFEKKEGIGKIIINRPPLNYISLETLLELNCLLADLTGDKDVKVVTITGSGTKAFCAGIEVADHLGERLTPTLTAFGKFFQLMIELDKPTIDVVHGYCLGGGCEVAAGCDMIIASDKAVFGQPEIKLAVSPPIAPLFFSRAMSSKKVFELVLGGDNIDAKEAEILGLVNKVAPADQLEKAAAEFAAKFAEKSGIALSLTRKLGYRPTDLPLERGLALATDLGIPIMKTEDGLEGLNSFLQKRKPVWKNK